jgi:hypothetical protein
VKRFQDKRKINLWQYVIRFYYESAELKIRISHQLSVLLDIEFKQYLQIIRGHLWPYINQGVFWISVTNRLKSQLNFINSILFKILRQYVQRFRC